jgi:hypothetical protein
MGVAGRAVQVRRRKSAQQQQQQHPHLHHHHHHQTYRDHELKDYRHQTDYWEDDGHGGRRLLSSSAAAAAMRRGGGSSAHHYHHHNHHYQVEAIDPFLLLGKMVRSAGTGLWKRVVKGKKARKPDNAAMTMPTTVSSIASSEAVAAIEDDEPLAEPKMEKSSEMRRMEGEEDDTTADEDAIMRSDLTHPYYDTLGKVLL